MRNRLSRLRRRTRWTVEVVVKLLQNAFFEAILPGFDAQVRLPDRRK
jgi:hypothetical protein